MPPLWADEVISATRAQSELKRDRKPARAQLVIGQYVVCEEHAGAFDCGVEVCSVIPTRGGNGALELLERDGRFAPPRLVSLEETLDRGLALAGQLGRGRVFVDLWDVERFHSCPNCGPQRVARLRQMNLSQRILPAIECSCA